MVSKEEKWRDLISQMRSSGKTQKAWCMDEGISFSTMKYWIKKFSQGQWIDVTGRLEREPESVRVKYGDFVVEIPNGSLVNILKVLKEL